MLTRKLLFLLVIIPLFSMGQNNTWNQSSNANRSFIVNKGQFDGMNWKKESDILFASKQGGWFTFFTKEGITHRLEKLTRNPKKKEGDKNVPSRVHISQLVHVNWLGTNNNVTVNGNRKATDYHSYAIRDKSNKDIVTNINNIEGYEQVIYKNIYNNIDVIYSFHKDGGIKYDIVLHPGANPSDIKLEYKTSQTNIGGEFSTIKLNQEGEIEIATSLATIKEHVPFTFYNDSKQEIKSKYKFNNNILSFDLENYDATRKVIIDPWVVTPVWDDGDFTREVETDAAGDVYTIGGETPMQLRKYNGTTGALIWTYNTPWDTIGGDWLGTLATDQAGVSYVTQGTGAEIERVSTLGAMVWHANAPFVLFGLTEYWTITFNCDNTRLIVGGTGGTALSPESKIYDIDLTNGSVLSDVTVGTQSGLTPVEVRSIAPTKNSKYVYLTHTEVGLINQNLTACSSAPDFQVDNTHHLGYKCENYLSAAQNGGGLKALVANDNYFYTHRGDQILQWDVTNGALLNTVALPGGSSNSILGSRVVHCSGLDVDVNGNVYAGSMDRVVKFDANLNFISQALTNGGFTVYDVSVNSNGEVIAGGALLDNGTATGRGGRIEALTMTAGGQYTTICCDPNFCPVGPLCVTDAPINLNPNTGGGTWSSVPATAGLNATTGVFDPATAGVGSYTITYTLACGSYTTTVQVNPCSAMSICRETNGDLTVSGGTGPYTWYEWIGPSVLTITNQTECTTCGGTWTFGQCYNPFPIPLNSCTTPGFWSSIGTGTTITPPVGADTIKVEDNFGDSVVSFNISTLPPCSSCDATITQAGPFCVNASATNLSAAQSGGTWTGTGITNAANGTFDPSVAGAGSHVITYTLTGCNDTVTIVVTPLPDSGGDSTLTVCPTDPATDLFNYLGGTPDNGGTWSGPSTLTNGDQGTFNPASNAAGIYTYTVTNSCGSSSNTVTVTISPNPVPGTNGTATLCSNDPAVNLFDSLGGSPDNGGTWAGPLANGDQGTFNPASDTAGTYTYTVIDCNSNPQTATVTVTIIPTPDSGGDSTLTICPTDPATDLFNYLGGTPDNGGTWSGPSTLTNGDQGTFNPASNAAGVYTYTVTNSCGTSSNTVTVTISANPVPGTNGTATLCSNDPAVNLFDSLGGSPDNGGTWAGPLANGDQGTLNPATDTAGTYTYTVIDCNSNPQTATVTVTIIPAPNSGGDSTLNICPTDPATDLFNYLGGSPDNGGTWSGPSALANGDQGTFNPASNASGIYTYTVTNSCGTSSNTVTVTISANPTPGTNGTATLCPNTTLVLINLFDSLGGTPSNGGTWAGPLANGDQGTFNPLSDTAGVYTYTVIDCNSNPQTATVTVIFNPAPNPGGDSTLTICPTDPATDLFNYLGGSPDNGGTWYGPSALANGDQGTFNPASNTAGTYFYSVTTSCGTDSAQVIVTISANPSPGTNGTATLCSNASNINLADSLNGSPDPGGTWSPALNSGTGIFDPSIDAAGVYTYTVLDCNSNPLTATVTVTVVPGPDAGTNGVITLCATDPSTDLFNQLGGTPSTGGTWSPALNSGTGVFDPSIDAAGVYTYTVTNSCGSVNATVTVTIDPCTTPTAGYTVSDSVICAGECVTFTDASTGATAWQWSFGGGNPATANSAGPHNVCFLADGTYNIELIVTNSNGADTTSSTVVVHPTPTIDAGSDVTIELGQSVSLNATGTNGAYTWSPPTWLDCITCPSPLSTPTETVTYTVVVVDSNGCTASDDVTVIVDFEYVIWVPNIFSPNGDGNNDIAYVRGVGVETLEFFIYDRWGEKVFETNDLNIGWDGTFRGKKMNNAVFVYYLEATFLDGNKVTKKGDITLIR